MASAMPGSWSTCSGGRAAMTLARAWAAWPTAAGLTFSQPASGSRASLALRSSGGVKRSASPHAGEGPLGALAPLEQPVGEVRALAQLRDRDVDGAGPGVEVAVAVAVAPVGPFLADGAVLGAADHVGL